MKITFVVAASENGVIGIDNKLPWHLPLDLKFFKKNTTGKPIIMGKNTFLSIGRPLPNRTNVVLSKSLKQAPDGTFLFSSSDTALDFLRKKNEAEACVIGGGQIFDSLRNAADEILLTRVHTALEGTTFFEMPKEPDWRLVWSEHHHKDEKHAFDFTFERWQRTLS